MPPRWANMLSTENESALFQFVSSPFCAKVRKILEYKGVDFEIVEVDYLERKELLAASGQLIVPAITTADGRGDRRFRSNREAAEELFPTPTIFPPGSRGVHLAMARFIDTELEDALFRFVIDDEAAHYRRQGADREAFWRLIRDRKFGPGFLRHDDSREESELDARGRDACAVRGAARRARIPERQNRARGFLAIRPALLPGIHWRAENSGLDAESARVLLAGWIEFRLPRSLLQLRRFPAIAACRKRLNSAPVEIKRHVVERGCASADEHLMAFVEQRIHHAYAERCIRPARIGPRSSSQNRLRSRRNGRSF